MKKLFQFKAIETRYSGCHFRSRLEARYAVLFDSLNIKWEYEPEGYNLDGIWYLPDFWLPEMQYWVEIKGEKPTQEEIRKAELLALYTGYNACIFSGNISMPDSDTTHEITLYHPPNVNVYTYLGEQQERTQQYRNAPPAVLSLLQSLNDAYLCPSVVEEEGFDHYIKFLQIKPFVPRCSGIQEMGGFIDRFVERLQIQQNALQNLAPLLKEYGHELVEALTVEEGWHVNFSPSATLDELEIVECTGCHEIHIGESGYEHYDCSQGQSSIYMNNTPRLIEAYTSARSARF